MLSACRGTPYPRPCPRPNAPVGSQLRKPRSIRPYPPETDSNSRGFRRSGPAARTGRVFQTTVGVAVEESEIVRRREFRQHAPARTLDDANPSCQPFGADIRLRESCVERVMLDGIDGSVRPSASEHERAVAEAAAHLENAPGPSHCDEYRKQRPGPGRKNVAAMCLAVVVGSG